MLYEMLLDPKNYCYFHFITPIVREFEALNAKFQQKDADPNDLSQDLYIHHQSLKNRLYHGNGNKKSLLEIDYGAKFTAELNKYMAENQHDKEINKKADDVRHRCMNVLEEALRQLESRPPARNAFRGLSRLSPSTVLSQTHRVPFTELPFLHLADSCIDEVEDQYRKLICVNWSQEDMFSRTGIPPDTEDFWRGIVQHSMFKQLATYALTCLVTPISNATVERVFSLVTCIKTKPRNRMQLSMLDALVRIRTEMILNEKCCVKFKITPRMLEMFKTDTVYQLGKEENEAMEVFL